VLDFLKVGLDRLVSIDDVTYRAEATRPKAEVSRQKRETEAGTYRDEKSEEIAGRL